MYKDTKAFTLVELLVVVAVIGMLASIVLVSLSGTKDKARLAQGQSFYAQLSHALAIDAAGVWKFEGNANDSSGHGNNGTVTGATLKTADQCGLGFGGCMSFDGNDWVKINGDVGLTGAMTISFWFNTPNKNIQYFFDNRSPGSWWFIKNYNGGKCKDNPGNICFENRVMAKDSDWNINEWTHVAVTDDTSVAKMYINGKLVDTGTGESTTISTNLRIGTRYTNSSYFQGMIDEVAVYNTTFTAFEIQQMYAQGAERHPLVQH